MFSYEMFINKMQRFSEEKVKNVVYANWYGNTILIFLIFLVIFDFLNVVVARINITLYYFIYFTLLFVLFFYIGSRKAGLALTENRVVYVKFKHLGYNEKEVHEIRYDKIKYLTVRKVFYMTMVNMSFLSNTGRLEKVKVLFSSNMIGPGAKEFKKNSKEIYTKLKEVQKVLDKGDF